MYPSLESLTLGLESNVLYPVYYRKHGIRKSMQLLAPPVAPLSQFELPRGSIVHWLPDDSSEIGIPQDHYLLNGQKRLIHVEHVLTLESDEGKPRATRINPTVPIRQYHKRYRMTRWCRDRKTVDGNPMLVLVQSYGLLPHLYRYQPTYMRGYFTWKNIQATVFHRINALAKESDRQQYYVVRLPSVLPTRALLKRVETMRLSRDLLARFNNPRSLFFLELWKWIGQPDNSLLGLIDKAAWPKVNFVFVHNGSWFMINLHQWQLYSATEGKESVNGAVTPAQLQLRLLKMAMTFTSQLDESPVEASPTLKKEVDEPEQEKTPIDTSDLSDDAFDPIEAIDYQPIQIQVDDKSVELSESVIGDHEDKVDSPENIDIVNNQLEKEFDAIDELEKEWEKNKKHETELSETGELAEDDVADGASQYDGINITYSAERPSPSDAFMEKANALADSGRISAAEYRRMTVLSQAYKKLDNPYDRSEKLSDGIVVKPEMLKVEEETKLPPVDGLVDDSMGKSTIQVMDSKYIKNVMHRDIMRNVVGLQHGGVAVTGYSREEYEDATGHYEDHTVQLTPLQGKVSTVKFRLPKVDPDGTFYAKGTRYRSRKMRIDVPIRKVNPTRVALTSAYGKLFVQRSEKRVFDYPNWLLNQIAGKAIDVDNQEVTDAAFAETFNSEWKVPRLYSTLAKRFRSLKIKDIHFHLDYDERAVVFGSEAIKQYEKGGMVLIGLKGKTPVLVDQNNQLYLANGEIIGGIEDLIETRGRVPIETADIKILGKWVPVGIFLGYLLGLDNLVKLLKVQPRKVPVGERLSLADDEYALRFADESWIFNKEHALSTMILTGFMQIEEATRNHPARLFDRKDIYLTALYKQRINIRYLREMDLLSDLFIDPTTAEILASMKEPTQLHELVIRATELLTTDWSPAETDMEYQRVLGYEKFAGAVYRELVGAIRVFRARGGNANAKIELPPYQIYQAVTQDPAVKIVEECNPIHNLKEQEEVTFTGTGGRSGRSMVGRTRLFHKNDLGVISESTKDSSDVAITTYLTPDAKFDSLRGTTRRYNEKTDGAARAVSTTALLMPAADHDDGKRLLLAAVQHSSVTHADGYQTSPLRTGYERVVASRVGRKFAVVAEQEGKVLQVDKDSIHVEYKDGTKDSIPLGRDFGVAAGQTYPHLLETTLKTGDRFKPGDCLMYNKHYFEIDPIDGRSAVWKAGVMARVAMLESPDTHEDASAVSDVLSKKLNTQLTKVRDIIVSFDSTIHQMVDVGDTVDADSSLCIIEDSVTADSGLFDEDSLEVLRNHAANSPRAKFHGTIEKIEVFHHGDFEDLSPSLQELTRRSNLMRKRQARASGRTYTSGRVDDGMRIGQNGLPVNHAIIRVYITGDVGAYSGD